METQKTFVGFDALAYAVLKSVPHLRWEIGGGNFEMVATSEARERAYEDLSKVSVEGVIVPTPWRPKHIHSLANAPSETFEKRKQSGQGKRLPSKEEYEIAAILAERERDLWVEQNRAIERAGYSPSKVEGKFYEVGYDGKAVRENGRVVLYSREAVLSREAQKGNPL